MRSLFPSTYDRADVLMSAGCSTFVSAASILVIPRVGIILLEILLGLFFIGCALAARARLRIQARSQVREGPEGSTNAKAKWFDRYDVLMILAVIVIYTSMSGLLRHAGVSEGTVGILPLILFAAGILLKPRAVQFIERRREDRTNQSSSWVSLMSARSGLRASRAGSRGCDFGLPLFWGFGITLASCSSSRATP